MQGLQETWAKMRVWRPVIFQTVAAPSVCVGGKESVLLLWLWGVVQTPSGHLLVLVGGSQFLRSIFLILV